MEISLKQVVLGLFLLIAVLVLVNVLFIMPYLSLKPVHLPTLQEEAPERRVKTVSVIPRVDSLQVIREDRTGEKAGYTDLDVKALRNPFFWPEEKPQQKKAKEVPAEKPAVAKSAAVKPAADKSADDKPQLSMVLVSAGRKQALMDDVFISEGDMFHGYRVKSIRDNEVILSGSFGDLRIVLGNGEEKEQPAQTPGGIIEK